MKYELKDYLNSINHQKNNLLDADNAIKGYPPYIVNRCLSGTIDTIMYANEMNINHFLDNDVQYIFLLNSLRPKKRFSPWLRADKLKDLEIVKQYYGYSNEKAKTALGMLSKDQLDYIKSRLNVGGKK
jgi:hypothetical protein